MFNIYEAFKTCDINDDGVVTQNEIGRLMESRGFYVSSKDLNTIMEKFDKDKDGRISYNEFMDEFLPKSPSKVI